MEKGLTTDKSKCLCDFCKYCFDDSEYVDGYLAYKAKACDKGNDTFSAKENGGLEKQRCEDFEPITFDYHKSEVENALYSDCDIIYGIENYMEQSFADLKKGIELDINKFAKDILFILKRANDNERKNEVEEAFETMVNNFYEYQTQHKE